MYKSPNINFVCHQDRRPTSYQPKHIDQWGQTHCLPRVQSIVEKQQRQQHIRNLLAATESAMHAKAIANQYIVDMQPKGSKVQETLQNLLHNGYPQCCSYAIAITFLPHTKQQPEEEYADIPQKVPLCSK